jgi:hypothetical protein
VKLWYGIHVVALHGFVFSCANSMSLPSKDELHDSSITLALQVFIGDAVTRIDGIALAGMNQVLLLLQLLDLNIQRSLPTCRLGL